MTAPTASPYSRNYVQKAYVAYYGRPADPAGQTYWAQRMDSEGQSLDAIIGAFGNSDEFNRRYGGLTRAMRAPAAHACMPPKSPQPIARMPSSSASSSSLRTSAWASGMPSRA